jgi:hypothetical protein
MGVDIDGWVEVRRVPRDHRPWHGPAAWIAVIAIGGLLDRNYDMFGCLFGVQNPSHFVPVAPSRGFPSDPPFAVEAEIAPLQPLITAREVHSASWITWSELKQVDWNVPAQVTGPIGLSSVDHIAKRREAIEWDWLLLFDLMRRLARDYGGDNVRLVVWFGG